MSSDATSAPPRAYPVLRSPSGLATALTILLAVAGAVDLFAALLGFAPGAGESLVPSSDDGPLTGYSLLALSAGIGQLVCLLGTGSVFIVWFHRARVNGEAFRPDLFAKRPGWAIGCWFVPVLNFFLPLRIAKEIWEASTQYGPDGSARSVSPAPVLLWWATFIGANFLTRLTEPGGNLLSAVSAVLAIVFVRKLTAMQVLKATEGPHAAV
ncbi:DUF4328 domain-containing protein [Streptomyces sp. G-G2]|uniref:DUF4328 domain-containing protein n=1 Tax=Streptomyces sp. G-G2 TaxID=3046201 RepID=UPI0024B90B00|nr:DUF4328 domain-containing protein [Streptomyces sp. G-G2]MDJ0381233.1 DUF4328 domain-containing protein [Streptomyces sp. G-G2]